MGVQKRFRQGQILKLLTGQPVASQDELRRQLGHLGVRVTQATLSRDLRELRLVKTVRRLPATCLSRRRRSLVAADAGAGPQGLPA